MYVADKFNNRIVYCYLNSTNSCRPYSITWSTAGTCTSYQCPGSGTKCCTYPAYLDSPTGVAVDGIGNLWIADRVNNRIVYCSGILGGTCQMFTKKISSGSPTAYSNPYSLVLGTSSSGAEILFFSDLYNNRIIACSGLTNLQTEGYTGCSVYTSSYTYNSVSTAFREVRGLALDGDYLYICDTLGRHIVVCTGIATTATSCQTYASGYSSGAAFGAPYGTARSLGYLYFADWGNNTVGYCVGDTTGACYKYTSTAAGTALVRPSGIGITTVTFEVYISDATNQRIVHIQAFTPAPSYTPTVVPTRVPTIIPTITPTMTPTDTPR